MTTPTQTKEDALVEAAAILASAAQARKWCAERRMWLGATHAARTAEYEATYRAALADLRRAVSDFDAYRCTICGAAHDGTYPHKPEGHWGSRS